MNSPKPFSESSEQNKDPILAVLREVFSDSRRVLEIGSGTGQHAIYFGKNLPSVTWHTSDVIDNHPGIHAWLNESSLENVKPPLKLDVSNVQWQEMEFFDGIFSANTVHIMHWHNVIDMFAGAGQVLTVGGMYCLYGPFNYNGQYTSQSNASFDQWLKTRDPGSGIRDFEALNKLALDAGLQLIKDYEMPANNRLLVWKKIPDTV